MNLKGRDLYSKVRILNPSAPLQDKNGEDYFRAVVGKIVFTAKEDFATDMAAGQVAELNLEEGVRSVDIDGVATEIATLTYAGHLTYVQLKSIVSNEGEITQLENSFKVVATEVVDAA